jgi:hypothetical protein
MGSCHSSGRSTSIYIGSSIVQSAKRGDFVGVYELLLVSDPASGTFDVNEVDEVSDWTYYTNQLLFDCVFMLYKIHNTLLSRHAHTY